MSVVDMAELGPRDTSPEPVPVSHDLVIVWPEGEAPRVLSPEQEETRVNLMSVLRSRLECHEADELFVGSWDDISNVVTSIAANNGFNNDGDDGMALALIHSEVSEVVEALRSGNPPSRKITEFSEVEDELSDILIRIMAFAKLRGFRVAEAVLAKATYNSTRPYKHGKLF